MYLLPETDLHQVRAKMVDDTLSNARLLIIKGREKEFGRERYNNNMLWLLDHEVSQIMT